MAGPAGGQVHSALLQEACHDEIFNVCLSQQIVALLDTPGANFREGRSSVIMFDQICKCCEEEQT